MRASASALLAALGFAASVSANVELGHGSFLSARRQSGGHDQLAEVFSKRATSETTSTLATIIEMVIPKCKTTCQPMISDLSSCAAQSTETAIATCACSSTALGDIRTCAACIAQDTTSSKNATAVVNDYNSFVKLCIADGLATVTGTVAVGASTSAVKHTTTTTKAKTTTKAVTTTAAVAVKSNIASVNATSKAKTTKSKTSSVVTLSSAIPTVAAVIPTTAAVQSVASFSVLSSIPASSASASAATASSASSAAGKLASSWIVGALALAGALFAVHA